MERNEKKNLIYNLMTGAYDLHTLPDSANKIVKNEMTPGSVCEKLYSEVYDANRRVCARLHVEEDKDVESIISNLIQMSQYLSMKMFDYGSDIKLIDKFDEEDWGRILDAK